MKDKQKNNHYSELKSVLSESWQVLFMILGIYAMIWLFKPSPPIIIVGVVLMTTALSLRDHYTKRKKQPLDFLWDVLKSFLFIYIIFCMNILLGGYGLLGFVILVLGLSAFIIFRQWPKFMWWIRYIERTHLYGKTREEIRKEKECGKHE